MLHQNNQSFCDILDANGVLESTMSQKDWLFWCNIRIVVVHIPIKWESKAMQHVTALKFQVSRNCKHDVHAWMNNTFILRPISYLMHATGYCT